MPPPPSLDLPAGPPAALRCTLRDPGPRRIPRLPPAATRVVRAIRAGRAGGLFPPLARPGPAGTVLPDGALSGAPAARMIARTLADPRFAPICDLLTQLDGWCRQIGPRYRALLAPGVLAVTNADLFGPLVRECFLACAAGPAGSVPRLVSHRAAQYQAFLELFLARLDRDRQDGSWPAVGGLPGPVTALQANPEETHNGGQRVLRLELADGQRVAYKPRPASGEALFLAPGGLFGLLNQLPPAAGRIRLPILPSWTGRAGSAAGAGFTGYSWQEWVEPPAARGVLRREGGWRLTGTVLDPPQAEQFWHDVGALTAVCFAFGVVDLHGENLLVGARRADDRPLMYPVDLEAYLAGVTRLADTGLVTRPVGNQHHHVGLEADARWCSLTAPPASWWPTAGGGLELRWWASPSGRLETRSVVADSTGRAGYAGYLPALLRGMFDAWTMLCQHRGTIRSFLDRRRAGHTVRVIPRETASYVSALRNQAGTGAPAGPDDPPAEQFDPAELAQLARGDVPYFFRAADTGGPLLCLAPPPAPFRPEPVDLPDGNEGWPPAPAAVTGERLTLAGLGPALRDAVEHVFDGIPEPAADHAGHRVQLRVQSPDDGQVSFDWPERDRRITYHWAGTKLRVRVESPTAPVRGGAPTAPVRGDPPATVAAEIRRRLLQLDRQDSAIRGPWTASGFTDPELEAKLDRLTDAGLTWLGEVIEAHGWPHQRLVGPAAAAAAGRLVQHARGRLPFRWDCLELVRQAAEAGELPRREIAYLTDALRLAEDRPQWYGTKFERVGDTLQPCPIEAPEQVDARRAELGLEPLAQYAERLRATFPLASHRPPAGTEEAT